MDLLAFLVAGGDPRHECFTHERGCMYEDD
jgi:hypothetical protein